VLISAPGKAADLTMVVGVNDAEYDPQRHDVISAASCTTNCVVPMAKVLHESFGDIIGDPASCVFDSGLTQAAGSLVKVFGWYDNEWGYTCRLADLAAMVGAQL